MANYPISNNFEPLFDVNVKEFAIGGKLLTLRMSINSDAVEYTPKEQIKEKMAMQLARGMLEHNMIEFTKQMDYPSDTILIHARCYVAPDEQVKILRIHESSFNYRR